LFSLDNIWKSFGGFAVPTGSNLRLPKSELPGLIGPHGAGKAIIFNVVSSIYVQGAGDVFFMRKRITGGMAAQQKRKE